GECGPELGEAEHRTVATNEEASELAVSAQPDPAGHVPLEGDPCPVGLDAPARQHVGGGLHHALWTTDEGDGVPAVPVGAVEQLGHDPHPTEPVGSGTVHRL